MGQESVGKLLHARRDGEALPARAGSTRLDFRAVLATLAGWVRERGTASSVSVALIETAGGRK